MWKRETVALLFCMACGLLAGVMSMWILPGRETWKENQNITVIIRENGSGTRDSFDRMFAVSPVREAVIANRNGMVLALIKSNPYAIGYGSLCEGLAGVKAVSIDGVKPEPEAVRDGSYPYGRFFYMVMKKGEEASFMEYVLSEEGQRVARESGYLGICPEGEGSKAERKIKIEEESQNRRENIVGSSSVMPLARRWAAGYENLYPGRKLQLQESDSASAIRMVQDGQASAALLSRDLTDEEKEMFCWAAVAWDGMVILVSEKNPVSDLTVEEVRQIFSGEKKVW